jgi:hypothetical protein
MRCGWMMILGIDGFGEQSVFDLSKVFGAEFVY